MLSTLYAMYQLEMLPLTLTASFAKLNNAHLGRVDVKNAVMIGFSRNVNVTFAIREKGNIAGVNKIFMLEINNIELRIKSIRSL